MDWPRVVDPILKIEEDDYQFDYDCPSTNVCKVLRDHGEETETIVLRGDEDWNRWFESDIFTANFREGSSSTRNDMAGYHILLCGAVEPAFTALEIVPSELYYLPFSLPRWRKITKAFHLHDEICRAFTKSHEGGCATYLVHDGSLRMYTAAMSWSHQIWTSAHSLAISSTYFEASKLTVAVIFGCSEQQMTRVEELLAESPEVNSHPLLTVGIFAELHKDRMQEIVKKAIHECTVAITDLKLDRDAPPVVKRDFKLSRKLRNYRLKTKMAEEEVRTTKGLLQKMITQVEEEQQLHQFQDGREFATSTRRFKQRFTEIEIELDALMARCRMMFDDMTYSEELFMNELLSDDAERARDQAKMSTVIAFVAMLYLPITAVATIFAMPVFEFQNDWRDIYFRETADSGPDAGKQPVLSSYFWVYLVVSVTLTAFTVFGWWHYARGSSKVYNRRKELKRMRQPVRGNGGTKLAIHNLFSKHADGKKDYV